MPPDGGTVAIKLFAESRAEMLARDPGNGIKFVGPGRAPIVRVSCVREGDHWRVAVADNGVGVEPKYFDQVS